MSNLLCQLLSINDAEKFEKISVCDGEQLITAMNVRCIPKIVLSKNEQMDAVENCMWILKECFNCRRSLSLNPVSFTTTQMLVTNLSKICFPVIVLVVGQFSSYNHVVVVWKKMINDIEHEYPFELTVDSINSLAGKKILS